MIWWVISAAIWLACGLIGSGWKFAYFQRAYPELAVKDFNRDRLSARCFILGGVGTLFVCCGDYSQGKMYGFGWVNPLTAQPAQEPKAERRASHDHDPA